MQTSGKLVSLVVTSRKEVKLICYSQADDRITTIRDYGSYWDKKYVIDTDSAAECVYTENHYS